MDIKDVLFYIFAFYVLTLLYAAYCDWRLSSKTGARPPPGRSGLTDPFGLITLLSIARLAWTMRNYEHFSDLVEKVGGTLRASILFSDVIMTVEPENVKAILATQFEEFGKGEEFRSHAMPFLGNGIFNADGPVWKHSRAMLRPQFLRNRVADLDIMLRHTRILTHQITPGSVTDFHELSFRMTLDTATDFLFGESTGTLESKDGDRGFAGTFAKIQEILVHRKMAGPAWRFIPYGKHIKDLDAFVDFYVQKTLRKSADEKVDEDKASFLDVLAQETRDPVVLRDQLVSTLLAGRDTTAATMSWAIKHLSNDPERYAKLRTEVLEVLGRDGIPTYAQLKNMPFLNGCIDETLRLYPIVPMNVRECLVDTTLPRGGGPDGQSPVCVAKGTPVWYIPLVMQRRQHDVPNVLEWQPERWASWTPKPWTYIPFNGGPRICLGQNFATVEMSVVLASIAQKYTRLENADAVTNDYAMRYDIILTPRNGTKVKFYAD